ncbi:MAG: hypothetical protein ACR2PG_25790 [Hyphomicrobiaceae bacterium]
MVASPVNFSGGTDRCNFAYWGPWGHVVRGWARAKMGVGVSATVETASGLHAYRTTGSHLMGPYFLGLQADVLLQAGEVQDGLKLVDEALDASQTGHIHFCAPELNCIKAKLLTAANVPVGKRIISLKQALATAREQNSRALEVKALDMLCREATDSQERHGLKERLNQLLLEMGEDQTIETVHGTQLISVGPPESAK